MYPYIYVRISLKYHVTFFECYENYSNPFAEHIKYPTFHCPIVLSTYVVKNKIVQVKLRVVINMRKMQSCIMLILITKLLLMCINIMCILTSRASKMFRMLLSRTIFVKIFGVFEYTIASFLHIQYPISIFPTV